LAGKFDGIETEEAREEGLGAPSEDDVEVVPEEGEEEGMFGVIGRFKEEGLVV
jgi:hypothetical protein